MDPSTRGVSDVKHSIAAIGSRSIATAKTFADKLKSANGNEEWKWGVDNGLMDHVKCGTYEDVYNDPVRIHSSQLHSFDISNPPLPTRYAQSTTLDGR